MQAFRPIAAAIALLALAGCANPERSRDTADPHVPAITLAQQVCANCHASLRLTQKYGLPTQTFQTFADSYHGLAVRGGSVEVVNCASCHSSHAIKSQKDPTSTINPANIAATCGQCHSFHSPSCSRGSVAKRSIRGCSRRRACGRSSAT